MEPPCPEEELTQQQAGHATGSGSRSVAERAWAEWDLIQKKVDSVSNFPFTVKAWSVAVSGFILGLGKGFEFPYRVLWAAVIVPFIFKAIESKHNAIRDTLGRRAELLERFLDRLNPLDAKLPSDIPGSLRRAVERIPGVALSLIVANNKRQDAKFDFIFRDKENVGLWAYRSAKSMWHKWIVPLGDNLFYLLQITLIVLVICKL